MICIIDCGTSWLEDIKRNVKKSGHSYKVIHLDGVEKCDFKSFSGIIISGASILLTQVEVQRYLDLFTFIKTVNAPILGICLGHQIMGLLYGSEIHKGKMINKKEHIDFVKNDPLFSDIENHSLFQEEHSEHITLPNRFHLLAKSDSCNNEVMKHKSKKMYGAQFHPEVSGEDGVKIFKNFLHMCSKRTAALSPTQPQTGQIVVLSTHPPSSVRHARRYSRQQSYRQARQSLVYNR